MFAKNLKRRFRHDGKSNTWKPNIQTAEAERTSAQGQPDLPIKLLFQSKLQRNVLTRKLCKNCIKRQFLESKESESSLEFFS